MYSKKCLVNNVLLQPVTIIPDKSIIPQVIQAISSHFTMQLISIPKTASTFAFHTLSVQQVRN